MKVVALVGTVALAAFYLPAAATEPTASETTVHKSHHAKRQHARAQDPYKELEPYRSFGFIGTYPGEYARIRASGECAIDLGYGRWLPCNSGGGGGGHGR